MLNGRGSDCVSIALGKSALEYEEEQNAKRSVKPDGNKDLLYCVYCCSMVLFLASNRSTVLAVHGGNVHVLDMLYIVWLAKSPAIPDIRQQQKENLEHIICPSPNHY